VVLLTAILLRPGHTGTAPVTVTYLQTSTNKGGKIDAWVRIANPGNRPILYSIASRECNTNGVWQIMIPPVLAGGEVRAGSAAEWAIPVEIPGAEWRVRVLYRCTALAACAASATASTNCTSASVAKMSVSATRRTRILLLLNPLCPNERTDAGMKNSGAARLVNTVNNFLLHCAVETVVMPIVAVPVGFRACGLHEQMVNN
jgi:hypothetical protein